MFQEKKPNPPLEQSPNVTFKVPPTKSAEDYVLKVQEYKLIKLNLPFLSCML